MALNDPPKTLDTRADVCGSECRFGDSEPEEEDLGNLESDVRQMAQRILEYRATLPDQLKNTFASILSAQRPVFTGTESELEPGPSGKHSPVVKCLSLQLCGGSGGRSIAFFPSRRWFLLPPILQHPASATLTLSGGIPAP